VPTHSRNRIKKSERIGAIVSEGGLLVYLEATANQGLSWALAALEIRPIADDRQMGTNAIEGVSQVCERPIQSYFMGLV
jgi:hypothetical protein